MQARRTALRAALRLPECLSRSIEVVVCLDLQPHFASCLLHASSAAGVRLLPPPHGLLPRYAAFYPPLLRLSLESPVLS